MQRPVSTLCPQRGNLGNLVIDAINQAQFSIDVAVMGSTKVKALITKQSWGENQAID